MFDFFKGVFGKKKEDTPPIVADISFPSPQKSKLAQDQSSSLILPRDNSQNIKDMDGFKYKIVTSEPDSDEELFDSLLNETISEDITLLKTPDKPSRFLMPATFEKTPVSSKVNIASTPPPSPQGKIRIKKDPFRFSTKSSATFALNMLPSENNDIIRTVTDKFYTEFDRWYFHRNRAKEDDEKKLEENEMVREAYEKATELYSALEEEAKLWEEIEIEPSSPVPRFDPFDYDLKISVRFRDIEDVVFCLDALQLFTQRACAEQEKMKDDEEDLSKALSEITSYPIDPFCVVEQTV